jgi:hypothetical protein
MWSLKFFLFSVVLSPSVCRGYHNVTVDDASSLITYTGTWMPLSEESNGLDFGGAHHVSLEQGSMATFSFTGSVALNFAIRITFISLQAWHFIIWRHYGRTP